MNPTTSEEKHCATCRYFVQHYGRRFLGEYFKICLGHCLHLKNQYKKHLNHPCETVCEHWESIADLKLERKEAIESTLRKMAKQIREMADILKEDVRS